MKWFKNVKAWKSGCQIFTILFALSVSVTVLPCGIVNTHGLFGEITTSTVTEDKDQVTAKEKSQYYDKLQKSKGANVYNIWFALLSVIICICLISYMIKLPRGDTIVTLKVRLNN